MRLDPELQSSLTWWFGIVIIGAQLAGDLAIGRQPDHWIMGVGFACIFGVPALLAVLRLLVALAGRQVDPTDPGEGPPPPAPFTEGDQDA